MTTEKINALLEEQLDELFPKGMGERGKALVLVALAQAEIEKAEKKAKLKILKELEELRDLPVFKNTQASSPTVHFVLKLNDIISDLREAEK